MLFFLAFLVATLQAATLKIEAANDAVLVLVDGKIQGRTPMTLQLEDGRYGLEFKKEEWQVSSVRYGLLVSGQTKGKMLVDWQGEEVKLVWAEDLERIREERAAAERARRDAEQRRIEEARAAEEEARRIEEEGRRIEEEHLRQAEEQRRIAEKEARIAEEEARRFEEERLRQAEEQRRIAEEEAREAAERQIYMKHREVGVAAMKRGDRRTALRAFRASRDAGDDDARITKLIAKLEGEVGTVRARVNGAKSDQDFDLVLASGEGEPYSPDSKKGSRWIFEDVPADIPLELRVAGHGYDTATVAIEPFGAGRRADVTATLAWRGHATLVLTDWPDTIRVIVEDIGGQHQPDAPGELQVTTGPVTISLDGPSGSRKLELELAEGATHAVPVKQHMPGAIVVEGLPAGSTLHLVEGPEGSALSESGVPRDEVVKEQSGVGIAGPLRLDNLLPGSYTVSVLHPILGTLNLGLDPIPGETTQESVLWETMSQAPAVKAARQDWEQRLAASKLVPKATKLSFVGGATTLAAVGVTTVFGVQALRARTDLARVTDNYDQAIADDNGESAWTLFRNQVQHRQTLRTTGTITLGGLGLSVVGTGVTVTLWAKGRKAKTKVEDWDLYALPGQPDTPTPAPAPAEPTEE